MKTAIGVIALGFALGACTHAIPAERPPSPPPVQTQAPPPPAPSPATQERPKDNCGLNPADMDDKTKVQCGLKSEEEASTAEEESPATEEQESPSYTPGSDEDTGDPKTFEQMCQSGEVSEGCSNADTPEDEGSTGYVPEGTDCTWSGNTSVYCEGPGGSYSYETAPPEGAPYYDPNNGN